jgi:hypothetical protein
MKRTGHHIVVCNSVHVQPTLVPREQEEPQLPPSPIRLLASWHGELDEDMLEALSEALRPRRHEVS